MTGPAGSNSAPTSGFTGSLQFPRLFWFVGFAAVLFSVVSVWYSFGAGLRSQSNRLRASVAKVTASRRVRLGLDMAVVAIGLIWVSWLSPDDTWKGGVCIEIGFGFAVMELLVYLFGRWSLRVARLAAYAVVAVYGALAWMHNSVSRYLNSIGAVPHDRPLAGPCCGPLLSCACLKRCSSAWPSSASWYRPGLCAGRARWAALS